MTLIRENLKRTPEERVCRLMMELQRFAEELRRAGKETALSRKVAVLSYR